MPPVCLAEEMRLLDERANKECQILPILLMETAGRAVAARCLRYLEKQNSIENQRGYTVVLCGPGNNGGDGYVVARTLADNNVNVQVIIFGAIANLKGEARQSYDILRFSHKEVIIEEVPADTKVEKWLFGRLFAARLVVDALLGVGLNRPLAGAMAIAADICNDLSCPVIAVDVPTGLMSDSGQVNGSAIKAKETVTFTCYKPALLLQPAASLAGEVVVADIGIPSPLLHSEELKGAAFGREEARAILPKRDVAANKGTFGHLFIVGGTKGKSGALTLTALGALRSGVGLTTVAATNDTLLREQQLPPECMTLPYSDPAEVINAIAALAGRKLALAFGPGWNEGTEERHLLYTVLHQSDVPIVLDAGALNIIAGYPTMHPVGRQNTIITPHPGEMSRLLRCRVDQILQDPLAAACNAAKKFDLTVVLKGAPTIVATADGRWSINKSGNNGLATGGSGDLLTGIIGSFLAQGLAAYEAARLGVYLHGLAADNLLNETSTYSILPTDVALALGPTIKRLLEE